MQGGRSNAERVGVMQKGVMQGGRSNAERVGVMQKGVMQEGRGNVGYAERGIAGE